MATPTSITLTPTIRDIGNFGTLDLSAFYIVGSNNDPADIISNGMQSGIQTITMPMAGATPTISITGLTRSTTYSLVIAISIPGSGGYYVSEIEERATAPDTAPSITIAVDNDEPSEGDSIVFTATAVDNEGDDVVIQWQYSSDGTTFADVAGETGATYTIASYSIADNDGSYRATATSTIHAAITSNVVVVAGASAPSAPAPGGGLSSIASGTMMITNALGGEAGGGTSGDRTVSSAVFGSRYPRYGGQTATSGGAFNMSMITFGDPTTGGSGSNFGGTSTLTLALFEAASTVTTDFPTGEGNPASSGSGFNTAMGVSGTAPTTAGVYNINVELDANGEEGLYQLEVGGGGGTTTHETPVTVTGQGTASFFENAFIGLPGGTTQTFTLGPATLNTSADCFIATNLPTDLNTVAVSLTPSTSEVSFGYAGFSGNIRWFGFRGVPSDMGTTAHTLNLNGIAATSGPPLISRFSGSITGPTTGSTTTTVGLDFTIGAVGGSAITSVVYVGGGIRTTLTEPAGGWVVGDYSFTGVSARTTAGGGVLSRMEITNSDGTYTTLQVTFV